MKDNPYRGSGVGNRRCSACGAELLEEARLCPSCGTEAPFVRCSNCMTLNAVGSEACNGCGKALDLEPEPAVTPWLCPRGCGPLVVVGDVNECERCGGLFVESDALATLVAKHRPMEEAQASIRSPVLPTPDVEVTYRPCPSCNVRMNRTVFGRGSGVVVDACKLHGTWFDARELTASLAFVERGGLDLVEKRDRLRKHDEARAAAVAQRTKIFDALNRPMPHRYEADPDAFDRAEAVRQLLALLIGL